MIQAYDILTVITTATMTGNELAVAAFVHPQLWTLDLPVHSQAAPPIARVLGKVMPFWYGLSLLLILGTVYEHRPMLTGSGLVLTLAATLWAMTIIFTIAMLVPINNRIAQMNPAHPYPTWLADRARWDQLHRIRVALLLLAVFLLLIGLF